MNPIMVLLAVSLFIGVRSHKKQQPISFRFLLLCCCLCAMAFYSQRLI